MKFASLRWRVLSAWPQRSIGVGRSLVWTSLCWVYWLTHMDADARSSTPCNEASPAASCLKPSARLSTCLPEKNESQVETVNTVCRIHFGIHSVQVHHGGNPTMIHMPRCLLGMPRTIENVPMHSNNGPRKLTPPQHYNIITKDGSTGCCGAYFWTRNPGDHNLPDATMSGGTTRSPNRVVWSEMVGCWKYSSPAFCGQKRARQRFGEVNGGKCVTPISNQKIAQEARPAAAL